MGLHAEGEEALAREWSGRGGKWDESGFTSAWRSFRASGNGQQNVTVASVFHAAKQHGYVPSVARAVRVRGVRASDVPPALPRPPINQYTAQPDWSPVDTPFTRFERGTDASAHPYMIKKRMSAQKLRIVQTWDDRMELGALFSSVSTGAPVTMQVVDATGKRKRNWPNYPLGDSAWRVRGDGSLAGTERVFVAEGIATAWACSEAAGTGDCDAFACAGKCNLRKVAEGLRCRYPALTIVVMSDRDAVDAATRAARSCAGRVAVIPDDILAGNLKADAWDVWDALGPAALAEILDAALEPDAQANDANRGAAKVGIAAVLHAMHADDELAGLLAFDRMRGRVVLQKERPWLSSLPGWTDIDTSNVELRLAERGIRAAIETVARACRMLAEEKAFHPVCRYLDGLHWDGVHRVDAWLVTHLGAEDTHYVREVGRVLLLSMVARVRFPGCKCDTMVVLEGRQGVGKSATLAALGGDFYSDAAPNLNDMRETGEALRGVWLDSVNQNVRFTDNHLGRSAR